MNNFEKIVFLFHKMSSTYVKKIILKNYQLVHVVLQARTHICHIVLKNKKLNFWKTNFVKSYTNFRKVKFIYCESLFIFLYFVFLHHLTICNIQILYLNYIGHELHYIWDTLIFMFIYWVYAQLHMSYDWLVRYIGHKPMHMFYCLVYDYICWV